MCFKKNSFIGYIDTIPLTLKKGTTRKFLKLYSIQNLGVCYLRLMYWTARLKNGNINKGQNLSVLIKDHAATQKAIRWCWKVKWCFKAKIRSVEIQNAPVGKDELKSIDVSLDRVDNQIQKSKIINPLPGTVLTKLGRTQWRITTFW